MTYLDFLEQKVLLERLVIGLEEPVLVKGLGELSAKIDSGNGGYNVIHGTDFHQQGNELMFTTHDSFGHEKKIQATVIDTIEVNMGGGNIENRPVIELDIKFAGEDYKKIPFSVSDRSTNTNPILISKGFVEKKLEALIDVGKKNISNDGIDVVYGESVMLDEGVLGAIGKGAWGLTKGIGKGIGKTVGLGAKGIAGAARTVTGGNGVLGTISNFGKWLSGDTNASSWVDPIKSLFKPKNKSLVKQIKEAAIIESKDKETITPKINNLTVGKKIAKDPKADLTNNVVEEWNANKLKKPLPISLVTSFMMCKGAAADKKEIKGLEKDRESLKGWITDSKENLDKAKGDKKPDTEEQEEGIPEQPEQATPSQEGVPEQPQQQEQQTPQEGQPQPQPQQEQQDDFEEVTTFLEQLCQFTLWFISIEKIEDEQKYQKDFREYIQSGKFDEILFKMFKSGEMSPQTIEPYVKKLAQVFQKDGKQGFFAICWTPQSQSELKDEMKDVKRQTYFYENLDYVAYQKKASNSPAFDQAEKQIEKENGIEETDDTETTDEVTDVQPVDVEPPADEVTADDETTDETTGEVTDEQPVDDETTEVDGEVTQDGEDTEVDDETDTDLELPKAPDDLKIEIPETIRGKQTKLEDPATQKPAQETQVTEEQPVDAEPAPQPIAEPQVTEETPAPETSDEVTEADPQAETEPQAEEVKPEQKNNEVRVKSRAQMAKHARNNKKAHRNKGKGKGENEEEPWIENEEDPWIKSKLQYFKSKGLI